MTYTAETLADVLASTPNVTEFYVIEEHAREQRNRSKVPSGSGLWNVNLERRSIFRVFIVYRGGPGKEGDGPTLQKALEVSLKLNGMTL